MRACFGWRFMVLVIGVNVFLGGRRSGHTNLVQTQIWFGAGWLVWARTGMTGMTV